MACQHLLSLPVDVHGRALPKRPKDLARDIQQLGLRLLEENAVRHYDILSMDLIGNALAMLADLKTLYKDKRWTIFVIVTGVAVGSLSAGAAEFQAKKIKLKIIFPLQWVEVLTDFRL